MFIYLSEYFKIFPITNLDDKHFSLILPADYFHLEHLYMYHH